MCTLIARILAAGLVGVLGGQGPVGGKPNGPGYVGKYPSKEAIAALAALKERESTAIEILLGPGPWRLGRFVPPIPYAPGPYEKEVLRLGELTVKGPHVELESPFCLWRLPVETDGDAAFVHELVTGEEHPTLDGERSERLEAALRFLRHYGTIVRGLRVAVVCDTERVVRGAALCASLMVYNASGRPVDVEATTTLHLGGATARYDLGTWPKEPRRVVLEPGQSIGRRIDLAALRFARDGEDPVGPFDAVPDGDVLLHVELALAEDARGNLGVVRSIPSRVEVVAAR